jgi:hypothetical protein
MTWVNLWSKRPSIESPLRSRGDAEAGSDSARVAISSRTAFIFFIGSVSFSAFWWREPTTRIAVQLVSVEVRARTSNRISPRIRGVRYLVAALAARRERA